VERRNDLRRREGTLATEGLLAELQKLEGRIRGITEGPCRCGKSHAECTDRFGCHEPEQREVDRLEARQAEVIRELERRKARAPDLARVREDLARVERQIPAAAAAARKRLEELDRETRRHQERLKRYQIGLGRLEKAGRDIERHEELAREAILDAAFELSMSILDAAGAAVETLVRNGKMALQTASKMKSLLSAMKASITWVDAGITPMDRQKLAHVVESAEADINALVEWDLSRGPRPSTEYVNTVKGMKCLFKLAKAGGRIFDLRNPEARRVLGEAAEGVLGIVGVLSGGTVGTAAMIGVASVNVLVKTAGIVEAAWETRLFRRLVEKNGQEEDVLRLKISRERMALLFNEEERTDLKASLEGLK
jgi:hypothetical protein